MCGLGRRIQEAAQDLGQEIWYMEAEFDIAGLARAALDARDA